MKFIGSNKEIQMVRDQEPRVTPRAWHWLAGVVIFITSVLVGCAHFAKKPPPAYHEVGVASWYGRRFHGRKTASGERFDQEALTAAHRTLPLGTLAHVRSIATGRSVTVRINDRGPQDKNRILDLSHAAAEALGIVETGTSQVEIDVD